MTKRSEQTAPQQSADPEAEAVQPTEQPEPSKQPPATAASLSERGGRALYGHARGLTGQKLDSAWNAVPAGLRAPYIERAQIVLNTLG